MPVITYAGTHLSDGKKKDLIEKLTEIASEVTGTPAQYFTVLIQEYTDVSLGISGASVEEIKSRLAVETRS